MAEILLKCPFCGMENDATATKCENATCRNYLKSELECLRAIDVSLRTVKRISIYWLILSIIGVLAGLLWFAMQH
jgi:hypothetical protein